MADVFDKETKILLKSKNTPDYETSRYIINPVFVPDCEPKYIIIEADDTLREMTVDEKNILVYQTESTIYLITEKQLLLNKDGRDYESDINAIINPEMPACELKYTKVVDNLVVEMTTLEKKEVDKPSQIRERNAKVTEEIRLKYSEYDEMNILRDYVFGDLSNTDQKMIDYKQVVTAAESKHPEIKAGKV